MSVSVLSKAQENKKEEENLPTRRKNKVILSG